MTPEFISSQLMHGFESDAEFFPCLVSRKLDGFRAVWIPGKGFHSKTGKAWKPEVLAHIVPPETTHWLDGELYSDELDRSEIESAVAINRDLPGPNAEKVKFFIFDIIDSGMHATVRYESLNKMFTRSGVNVQNCCIVPQAFVRDELQLERICEVFRNGNAEGVMLKAPYALYRAGRRSVLFKRKFWRTADVAILDFVEGIGKMSDAVGAVKVRWNDKEFEIGTMRYDHHDRRKLWTEKDKYVGTALARMRYINLSRFGIPQNASIEGIFHKPI